MTPNLPIYLYTVPANTTYALPIYLSKGPASSTWRPIYLSINLSICRAREYNMTPYISIYLSIYQSICRACEYNMTPYLSIHLCIYHLSTGPASTTWRPTYLSIYASIIYLQGPWVQHDALPIYLSMYLSIYRAREYNMTPYLNAKVPRVTLFPDDYQRKRFLEVIRNQLSNRLVLFFYLSIYRQLPS